MEQLSRGSTFLAGNPSEWSAPWFNLFLCSPSRLPWFLSSHLTLATGLSGWRIIDGVSVWLFPTKLCGILVFGSAPPGRVRRLLLLLLLASSSSTLFHTIFHIQLCHTPSFTHSFVTHHLSYTSLSHTQLCHIQLCHTHNFVTHHLSRTALSHTIFHTHLCHTPSFTHIFVTHHLSHTIFVTQLCHTPSFTHIFVKHHLSHTICVTHTQSLSHTIFHTSLSHTIFHTHNFVTHHLSRTSLSHTIFHTSLSHHLCHTTLSHTIFHTHTHLCHTPSFSHHMCHTHTALSHTIFHTHLCHTPSFTHNFVTHHLSRTSVSHTIFHTSLSHTIYIHLHSAWQEWHLWDWAGSGGALGGPLVARDAAALLRGRGGTRRSKTAWQVAIRSRQCFRADSSSLFGCHHASCILQQLLCIGLEIPFGLNVASKFAAWRPPTWAQAGKWPTLVCENRCLLWTFWRYGDRWDRCSAIQCRKCPSEVFLSTAHWRAVTEIEPQLSQDCHFRMWVLCALCRFPGLGTLCWHWGSFLYW